MNTEMPLNIEGHLFTCAYIQEWTLSKDPTFSLVLPQFIGCGCDLLLPHDVKPFERPQESYIFSNSEVSRPTSANPTYTHLHHQSPRTETPQSPYTPRPFTPTKQTESSIGPVRRKRNDRSVKSLDFAPVIISHEQAARPAGQRRRTKGKSESPRGRTKVCTLRYTCVLAAGTDVRFL
jgi:hypothetical protein